MTYQESIDFLYASIPAYHRVGPIAYKGDLTNIIELCKTLGHPETRFKSIHVAGTNGKGSSSHMLAAILQSAGLKTGLYTSPHLKDFTERIRINGVPIAMERVAFFVEQSQLWLEAIKPSFFELTTAMAFQYFAEQEVDIAVIETGLGGRLDSTNIIQPLCSLITNIGFDHTDILGNTLQTIAAEKAGIIKANTPIVISERQPETEAVFLKKAELEQADLFFATDSIQVKVEPDAAMMAPVFGKAIRLVPELKGLYQQKNIAGVLKTVEVLHALGISIPSQAIESGINKTVTLTGLKGRWQTLNQSPLVIADTAHNAEGLAALVQQITLTPHEKLHWVFGMVGDKDPNRVLSILPKSAHYYFCQAKIERALPAVQLQTKALEFGLLGEVVPDVNAALLRAKANSHPEDLIMVGGSTFVVAELNEL